MRAGEAAGVVGPAVSGGRLLATGQAQGRAARMRRMSAVSWSL
jgi:hypothetical protein